MDETTRVVVRVDASDGHTPLTLLITYCVTCLQFPWLVLDDVIPNGPEYNLNIFCYEGRFTAIHSFEDMIEDMR